MKELQSTKAVIITTGTVVKDARKVLSELDRSMRENFRHDPHPLLIEGVEHVDGNLKNLIHNSTIFAVLSKCREISAAASLDLEPVFENFSER